MPHAELYAAWGASLRDFYVAGAGGIWHSVDSDVRPIWANAQARVYALTPEVEEDALLTGVGVDYGKHRALSVNCRGNECTDSTLPESAILKQVVRAGGATIAAGLDAERGGSIVLSRASQARFQRRLAGVHPDGSKSDLHHPKPSSSRRF